MYNKEFLKTKIKPYGDEVTGFYDKKLPMVDSSHTCLAVIILDSALKKDDSYCPHIEKKVIWRIDDNLSYFSFSDESEEE